MRKGSPKIDKDGFGLFIKLRFKQARVTSLSNNQVPLKIMENDQGTTSLKDREDMQCAIEEQGTSSLVVDISHEDAGKEVECARVFSSM